MNLVPAGKYKAKAIDWGFGKSEKKGTPVVRVLFEIIDGPEKGREVTWNGYFTEKTEERTVKSLRSCGCIFPDDDATNLIGIDTNEVNIVVKHEAYEKDGARKVSAKVEWINGRTKPVKEQLKSQMGDAERRQFAAGVKGLIRATATVVPVSNDDIDF